MNPFVQVPPAIRWDRVDFTNILWMRYDAGEITEHDVRRELMKLSDPEFPRNQQPERVSAP